MKEITMEMMESWIPELLQILKLAGNAILEVYHRDFSIQIKSDNSPVTEADVMSSEMILKGLQQLTPEVMVICEESPLQSYTLRSKEKYLWLLDPLDGTSEFISRNDEFVISLALIHENVPVLGLLYAPVTGDCFYGIKGNGAKWIQPNGNKINIFTHQESSGSNKRVLISRSHRSALDNEFLTKLNTLPWSVEIVETGSALKFAKIAAGMADIYPKMGTTMEWDTAAGQCILMESGGKVFSTSTFAPLKYNKEHLKNDYFIACSSELSGQLTDLFKENSEHR